MYTIISDGGCDFSKEQATRQGVHVVPFYITLGNGESLKEGQDISKEDYFARLANEKGFFPKTSQPSPQDYIDAYTPHLEAGQDILSLTISSKFSGSYNSAMLAANILRGRYPERRIAIVDSFSASIGQGLILREIIRMRDAGLSLKKTVETAGRVIKTTHIYFTPENLEYLKRGGRVGPTTAFVGGILGLRPILHLQEGNIAQLGTVRGKKNMLRLVEQAMVDALQGQAQDIILDIGHIHSESAAATLKANITSALGIENDRAVKTVGAAIGTHVGPGALAFAYCKKYESCIAANSKEAA